MVKDKRMIILYALPILSGPCIPYARWSRIISCDQPLFTLYFSVWEILRGFYSPFHSLFHLSIPFTSLSLSVSLSLISPSLSISLLLPFFLSIILFSVSNGRFRPCSIKNAYFCCIFSWPTYISCS